MTVTRFAALLGAGAALVLPSVLTAGTPPLASPQTTTFEARLTITKECEVGTVGNIDFTPADGVGFLTSELTATTTIAVGCTKGTEAAVKLDDGANFSGTRRMRNGTDFIAYELFSDAGYTTPWDSTDFPTVTGTGGVTGTATSGTADRDQMLTVYGRVPSQDTGAPGDYVDTVTVSVEF
ncbi:MAG TPA: spore coat U domain-containing protein [Nevskiaceae bacterium]|nr:spore coat U domain-containing protein [Nevskiaceae bacterium]